jgi:hypothetical protein
MRYYLGPERDWIRIGSEELVIRFDSAGNVVDAGTAATEEGVGMTDRARR